MKGIWNLILLVISVTALGVAVWIKMSAPKMAYVNSYQVLEEYEGMKETQALYQQKLRNWHKKADSLRKEIDSGVKIYNSEKLDEAKKADLQNTLQHLKGEYAGLEKTIAQYTETEVQILSNSVLDQINTFINKYGKEKGYDIILGLNETGTVIYGKETLNITEEVIKQLNNEYLGNE